MLRVYLVRHGVTVWNDEGRLQGHTDVPLSPLGVEQARRLGARLAAEPVGAVWSSDMQRARVTAEAVAARHGLPVTATPLLRETMLGEWEGLTKHEIIERGHGDALAAYRLDPLQHRPPGSETLQSAWDRVVAAGRQAREAHPEGALVLVGHGGSLRALLCEALCAPIAAIRRIWLDNASLSLIEYDEDRTWVRLVNDTGHLRDPEPTPTPP